MRYFVLLALFFLSTGSIAQQTVNQEPVKVGLVLSGGGAKGIAHIGAMKVIE